MSAVSVITAQFLLRNFLPDGSSVCLFSNAALPGCPEKDIPKDDAGQDASAGMNTGHQQHCRSGEHCHQHHADSKQYRQYKQNRYDTNNHSEHFQRPPFVVSGDSLTVDQAYHAGDAEYRTGSEKYLPLSFFLRIILSLCVFLWYNAAKLQ